MTQNPHVKALTWPKLGLNEKPKHEIHTGASKFTIREANQ